MPTCTYSGKEIPPGTGLMYVKTDGKVLWFLDRKAEKGFTALKRKPRNVRWTAEAHKAKAVAKTAAEHTKAEAQKTGEKK